MAKKSTSPPLFDTYVLVDWSASKITIRNGKPTIKNGAPKRDAIWWAIQRRRSHDAWKWPGLGANYRSPSTFDRIESCAVFERTRHEAIKHIAKFLAGEARARKRVLVGFDFAFGYPAGFAQTIEATTRREPSARGMRQWLYDKMLPDKKLLDGEQPVVENNHFCVASCLNEAVKVYSNRIGRTSSKPEQLWEEIMDGPFWDGNNELRTVKKGDPHDPYGQERGKDWPPFGFQRRRRTDELAKSRPVWQLTGSGSVGSQVLLGLPWLQHLYNRLLMDGLNPKNCGIWPFDHGDFFAKEPTKPRIVIAEIYPSLITKGIGDMIPDRSQVVESARAFELLDTRSLLKDLFDLDSILVPSATKDAVTSEEGWILGTGCDHILQSVAKEDSALFRKEIPNGKAE